MLPTKLAGLAILLAPWICFGQTTLVLFAGAGPSGFAGDAGPATSARLSVRFRDGH